MTGGTYSRNHGTRMWSLNHSDLLKTIQRNWEFISPLISIVSGIFTIIYGITSGFAFLALQLIFGTAIAMMFVPLLILTAIASAMIAILELCKASGWMGWTGGGMYGPGA